MKAGEASRTAAWVATARTLGAVLPPGSRLVDDPWGVRFADAPTQAIVARALAHPAAAWPVAARVSPLGAIIVWMQVRTRFLDDEVRRFVAAGGRQLVLLGAGYDCRAVRLRDLLSPSPTGLPRPSGGRFPRHSLAFGATKLAGKVADTRVYEIDHPATQARKRGVLAAAHAPSANTKYLAWDFEARPTSELPSALEDVGHDPSRPSLTIWEGVTVYLSEPAIDATVRAVAQYSGAGSRFAVTYFTRASVERPSFLRALVKLVGEPYRFGWDPARFPSWMSARGWRVDSDESDAEMSDKLLPPETRKFASTRERRIAVLDRIPDGGHAPPR